MTGRTDEAHPVRLLGEADGALYRDLRLEALRLAPRAFSSSYEEERELPLSHFVSRCAASGSSRVFAVCAGGSALSGMAGLYFESKRKLAHKAHVWGVFVHPSARGRGCGAALMQAAVDCAQRAPGVTQIHLGVAVGNEPAVRLYRALGFETYGTEPQALQVDGEALDELLMVRLLR